MKARFLLAAGLGLALAAPVLGQNRTVLPMPAAPFDGSVAENVLDSKPAPLRPVRAPEGAPNVLLFMSDDVGFAMTSGFGGPVPTPNFDRLARMGQRYNRFHTTGICSPSRAALLTGRNHHNAGVGFLSDMSADFPGYGGRILPETATIAQMLRLNGYSTAMFGKHHNTPTEDRSEAGPFDSWPTGLGFEYFYGFVAGDTDQFRPALYRGTSRIEGDDAPGKLLDERLADDLIRWVHNQKAGAPDKPFLAYLAPGSTHAPHQAPPEWIARFKGKFDQGWDKLREETFRRQLASGIVPRGTQLTARPEEIPAWDSLTPERKAFAARAMEVAAAQMAFQDAQFGRILAELERMGELDNTLIVVVHGDNGASGEVDPAGTVNELRSIGFHDEDPAWLLANTSRLGGPKTYGNYPVGWSWAMNTPLRWTKQYASMLGGIRNGMIMAWPARSTRRGAVCAEFGHLVDVVPTVLEATGLPAPETVLGAPQKPIDGKSLLSSLTRCKPAKRRTQYFEIGGKAGLWQDGWFLSGDDGRIAWEMSGSENPRPLVQWTLYNLERDFSQSTDLSAREPERLARMQATWRAEAQRNNVFPLDFRSARGRGAALAAAAPRGPRRVDFWGKEVTIPTNSAPRLVGRSFTLEADLQLHKPNASGVVVALGSQFGGWSLYLDEGRPVFTFARSLDPNEIVTVRSGRALPQGANRLRLRFAVPMPGKGADVTLFAGGAEIAHGQLPTSILIPAGGGETFDIGRDLGVPVTSYRTPQGAMEGDVPHVVISFD